MRYSVVIEVIGMFGIVVLIAATKWYLFKCLNGLSNYIQESLKSLLTVDQKSE